MNRSCEYCKFWELEDISEGHICCNGDSEFVAEWTEPDDTCPEWEEKTEEGGEWL